MRVLFFAFLWMISLCPTLQAQSSHRLGMLPKFNLNVRLSDEWKLNTKIETRHLFSEGISGQPAETGYRYSLTDIALVAAKKTGANSSLAGGYMIRLEERNIIHRFIQQYSRVRRYASFRLGQRFSADETFERDEAVIIRLRYRIGLDIPLNGQSVDPREFYVKLNNEYLNVFRNGDYDLEIRFIPLLGYAFADNNKLEAGLDYRLNGFVNNSSRNSFWFQLGWFLSI